MVEVKRGEAVYRAGGLCLSVTFIPLITSADGLPNRYRCIVRVGSGTPSLTVLFHKSYVYVHVPKFLGEVGESQDWVLSLHKQTSRLFCPHIVRRSGCFLSAHYRLGGRAHGGHRPGIERLHHLPSEKQFYQTNLVHAFLTGICNQA